MARTVLEVVVAADPRSLERGLGRAGKATDKFGKQAQQASHRATVGFKSIGTGAKLAGGAIVASGVAAGIRDIAKAATDSEVSTGKLKAQLKASGISYKAHAKEIDKVIQKHSQLAAIDDEDLQDAFTNIVRANGSVAKSMKLTGVAADIARAKNMDVAKAGELVGKVSMGNTKVLKSLGVAFSPVTKAQDELAKSHKNATQAQKDAAKEQDAAASKLKATAAVAAKFAGQGEAFGKTAAGSQERMRIAMENLQELMGSKLVPILADGADKAATFITQIETGVGAGGRFADTLGEVADGAKDVYAEVKPIAEGVGEFVKKHPDVAKFAGGLVAVGLAVKTIKFAGAITGVSSLMTTMGKVGAGPGRSIGGKVVGGITSVLSTSGKGIKSTLTSVLSGAGRSAGATAADATGTSMAGGLRSGKNNGKFRASGGVAGRIFGRALVGGALVGIVGIGVIVADKINEAVTDGLDKIFGGKVNKGIDRRKSFEDMMPFSGSPLEALGGLLGIGGNRKGGIISRFQGGGMVPAFVSPGEMVVHGGQAMTVPGARVAADSVFTHLPVGAAVLTDHGQSLMAGGASLSQAVAMQAPHFAKGGIVMGQRYEGDARTLGFEDATGGIGSREAFASIIGGALGKRVKATSSPSPRASSSGGGGITAGGGWGGSENIVRSLARGFPMGSMKRAANHPLSISNPSSDHNTANAGAFAVDLPPGDGVFNTIRERAGIPAQKGSWNNFSGKPVAGYRTQLLWHAPDGSHRDHVHLGVRKMRAGGFAGFRKGGSVASVLAAGGTDTKGVTAAFAALAKRLADGTRSTFTTLGSLIRSASAGAAAARKAGDKVDARRYDSVGNLARYEQGRRMAAPILRLGTVTTSLDRQEGRFASRQTIAGVDSGSAAGIAASIARGENSLGQLKDQMPGLKRALSQAKKTKNKKAIAEITQAIEDLDDGILARQASLAEQGRALDEAKRAGWIKAKYDDTYGARQDAASLALLRAQVDSPEDNTDDLAALNASLQAATEGYNAAIAAGDGAEQSQFGGDILSLRQSIEGMAANVADNTAALEAQIALQAEELDFRRKAFAIGQAETGTLGRALASLVSGELGGRVGLGLMTPGYAGQGARY